ncbi:ArsR/SmtB family transcription factor [Anaerofustis stercorihominis]|uniref:Transcriptional regulator, ArsR family n=2 Tax=Anaerofustis stercorihominis TaxID=214853 RepID=B1CAV9_9FIRM|nr:metalloregulator ArsR/SmtB family transcription factor [Anaerofustis stercorihominis]EDS71406.1 transcriptional regulator, ArsR family [Anaerofustis stercorihominis DSM 17244]MCQ4795358.1 metalloregulator ArsR/SmtB family transcription factor [Anaerofustis stercorihominis]RGD73800.1 ArsR family transcriptional regulator [Anaerofustis stercorihominis]
MYQDEIKKFKALSDENRLTIIHSLKNNEKCACKLLDELNISQSTLSHHMKILCDAGLVIFRKEGKWMHYRINKDEVQNIIDLLESI